MNDAELDPEDAKLVVLARAARARTGAAEGAAVRDDLGRTYVAGTVALPSLGLSAVEAAVAAAVASGARTLDAAALVTPTPPAASPLVLADLGASALIVADPAGVVVATHASRG